MSDFIGIFKKEDNQFNICIHAAVDTSRQNTSINKYEDYFVCQNLFFLNDPSHHPQTRTHEPKPHASHC